MSFVSILDFADLALLDGFQLTLQLTTSTLHDAAVDFKLLLTRPTRSDADGRSTGHGIQVRPHCTQSGVGVLHLRDLNLQLRGMRRRSPRKDVEDEFTAIDDFA